MVLMASGNGSNVQVLLDEFGRAVKAVFSNRAQARVLERARAAGVDAIYHGLSSYRTREEYDRVVATDIKRYDPSLVVMAGWMHICTAPFFEVLEGVPIINVHPAYLPDDPSQDTVVLPDGSVSPVFRGAHALRDALKGGAHLVGTTVHYVGLDVDRGQAIERECVAVRPDDTEETLRARVQAVEHRLLPAAVRKLLAVPVD